MVAAISQRNNSPVYSSRRTNPTPCRFCIFLAQTSGLTFGFEQAEDVVDTDGALDVTDDGTALVIHELDTDLGHTTARAGTAEDAGHLHELNGGLGGIHCE